MLPAPVKVAGGGMLTAFYYDCLMTLVMIQIGYRCYQHTSRNLGSF